MGLVEGHGASRAQIVGSDLMHVESQPLESNIAGGRTEVEDYVGPRDQFLCSPWGHIIGTNGCVGRGIMKAQVKVATGCSGDWIPMRKPRGLHCARFPANTVFLGIQIKFDRGYSQKYLDSSLCRDDAIFIMELHVQESELGGATV